MRSLKSFSFAFVLALVAFSGAPSTPPPAPASSVGSAILVDTNGDGKADKAYIVRDADDGSIVAV